ncbi:MAG: transcriptional regulator, LacI family [Proteobacteria bacterium]|nr:transcriptional regulator, LacI family [Pseudomonadota bacterium]
MTTPAKARKSVTIKDVARKAGTSIATVSYVFSNAERYLRPELRERVQAAAAEIGYVKNAAASSIKGKRRGILAIVVAQFGNSFFTRMCVEIVSIARQAGYVVTLCNSDEDPEQERIILERLVEQRIDGCILCPALSLEANTELLRRHRIPYVILERSFPDSSMTHNFVGHDNFQSGYLATLQLLAAGHRRIAFSGWDSPIPNVRERVDGYQAALREYGVAVDNELVLTDELSADAGRRMGAQLMASGVSAAVLGHHETAKGALLHFQDHGLRWPEDLSLVMIGTPEWAGVLLPQLTCIERPEHEMAVASAELLLSSIEAPDHPPLSQLFHCTAKEGKSVLARSQLP